ncbi:DEAD/DEAH box helicase family protein [Clostridium senegalense]|uniref:DEAD/DEAH box helicase family protein n=1 Tax=Clostridium senegalense TaxID=1465809 RepID=UPI000288DE11|nr:DEAD/DEAH box helicase family protein [Clostridium senegalense]
MPIKVEEGIFHPAFANGLITNGYKGVNLKHKFSKGMQNEFDESENEWFMEIYDKENCINPEIVIRFIKRTQQDKYDKLVSSCGSDTNIIIIKSLVKEIEEKSVLDVLKNGFKIRGLPFNILFEIFAKKPTDYSVGIQEKKDYEMNEFWCVHELKYCELKPLDRIDFVIFLNGLPLFDFELKDMLAGSQYTYIDAINQYEQRVRDTTVNNKIHKYWSNKTGPLVHFAIDNENIYISTELKEKNSLFMPFNMGQGEGKSKRSGNPMSKSGYNIEYLYKHFEANDIIENDYIDNLLSKDNVSDIVNNFIYYEGDKLIFPRYHQLNVVLRVEDDLKKTVRDCGVKSKNYLIQHSAGSGKTKSITWLAYKSQALKQHDGTNLFGAIIILTDRNIVIGQLGDSIWSNDKREDGMIERIEMYNNKSDSLRNALKSGKRIITCTIQSFLNLSNKQNFDNNKRYLIIIDESHSSTNGEDIKAVKKSLSLDGNGDNISFVGFTATPKESTLTSFGIYKGKIKDNHGRYKDEYIPFDVYSMRQAIEEKFILDVFDAYKTIDTLCRLVLISDDREVERNAAQTVLNNIVDNKSVYLENKVDFIIEDFYMNFYNCLNGEEKIMILTNSKSDAVRYYKTINEKLRKSMHKEMHNIGVLISYSGTDDYGKEENYYNNIPKGQDIPKYIDENKNIRILILVDKYQTGYDQPKLVAMYIDKDLESRVQIVQTLSRLNRPYYIDGKIKPISIVDFRNDFVKIKDAFQIYYETTYLERKVISVDDLNEIKFKLYKNKILNSQMVKDVVNNKYDEIAKIGKGIRELKKSNNTVDRDKGNEYVSDIYSYIRLYKMLMEDKIQKDKIVNNNYQLEYCCLNRLKYYVSSLVRPKINRRQIEEEIESEVGTFITVQSVDGHDEQKNIESGGHLNQGFLEKKITNEVNEKEKLSKLIKEFNGDDDSVSRLVEILSHKPILRSCANNKSNSENDFNRTFEDIFTQSIENLLNEDKIVFKQYIICINNWQQLSELTYKRILNTKV